MTTDGFARLQDAVLGDPDRTAVLVAITDEEAFLDAALALADELGLPVDDADVRAAFEAGRRRRIEHSR